MKIFNFFRKKQTKENLEKALHLKLITEEEFLKLEILRAEKRLEKLKEKEKKR